MIVAYATATLAVSTSTTTLGQLALAVIVLATAYFNKKRVAEVHVLVNSQKTEMERRIAQLEAALNLQRGEEIKPGSTVKVEQETKI